MRPCSENEELRRRPFVVAVLVALVAAGLAVESLPGAGFHRGPRIRAVRAKADAFVSQASRHANFGHARTLRVDASPTVRSYVRFDVDLSSGDIAHVSLLVYSKTRSRRGFEIRLAQGPWSERKVNFTNAPGLSPEFAASGPLRANAWKAVDVTSLATGEETAVNLVLTTSSPEGAEFASRETGLHGPRLVVETNPPPETTRTSTTGTTPPGGKP